MNHGKPLILILAIFIALTLIPFPKLSAQTAGPQLVPSESVFSLWRVGGKANFTALRLFPNLTYYVWSQRPNDPSTRLIGITISARTGTTSFQLPVASTDPPGTYLVSLSTSTTLDERLATAHFGIFGIDRSSYRRTDTLQIGGGGFFPNSTISILFNSGGQAAGNLSLQVDGKGNFNSAYRLSQSVPLGTLTVTVTGSGFDDRTPVSARTSAVVAAAQLNISQVTQPESIVVRTGNVDLSLTITYPDGSPVITATQNATRVIVVNDQDGGTATEVQLKLSDPATGAWGATWSPPFSASLGSFHFQFSRADFDDNYGNIGRGNPVTSNSFRVTAAHVGLAIQSNSTVERTLPADVVIVARYPDGTTFHNVTQASGTITEADGTVRQLTFNGSLTGLAGNYKTNATTPLGMFHVAATVADIYGNTATGAIDIQVVPAVLAFVVNTPVATQRTTILNATARVTYPDGALVTQNNLPLGFNVTISAGNFTWTHPMLFDPITNDWSAGYVLPQNATLGNYAITMNATDPYRNFGQYSGIAKVIPATFTFELERSSAKANPNTIIYIDTSVIYPNGSALTPSVGGGVAASLTNSSGTFTYPMVFNATDQTWFLYFPVPDPGFKFGLTITFSFNAADQFGNAGSAAKAFKLDVGAGVQSLILATIIGAIIPIGLIGWAIATISGRRRKHKP